MEILSPLHVIMINDWRGVAVGRAGFSLWCCKLSLKMGLWSLDVHKHAHKIRSLSRWYSVLGRRTKSQIGIHYNEQSYPGGQPVFSYLSLVGSQELLRSALIGSDKCLRGDLM